MFEFSSLLGPKIPAASGTFLSEIDNAIKTNASYMQTIEKWRNLEISFLSKLAELKAQVEERNSLQPTQSDNCLMSIFETLLNNHKNLVNKLNHDIFLTNFDESQKMISEQRALLEQEKGLHKELTLRREAMERVQSKKTKLRKTLEQQLTLQIFSEDSCDVNMGRKVKRFNRLKEISKEQADYELKVKQTKEIFDNIVNKTKENLAKFTSITEQLYNNRIDMALKMQLHIATFSKNLASDMEELNKKQSPIIPNECSFVNQFIENEQEFIREAVKEKLGYLEVSLRLINEKNIDEIIEYSKDKEIKKKIKKIIESNSVNPEDTDELTRQVQLVKKIMKNKDCPSMAQFKTIIVKNCKFRMNFVFILQLYRLNSKFEIPEEEVKPMILLINELLLICHEYRDAFVLKQIMVLMMTYYVVHRDQQGEERKIYIVSFFKELKMWKDIELWESILIECIYLQKKATIKMLLVSSSTSNRSELVEAEKTAMLNQILYIVRNMVLFDFSEREVKDFTNKFVKLLKQDDRFLKDVHKSIDNALKEENDNRPPADTLELIKNWTEGDGATALAAQ